LIETDVLTTTPGITSLICACELEITVRKWLVIMSTMVLAL